MVHLAEYTLYYKNTSHLTASCALQSTMWLPLVFLAFYPVARLVFFTIYPVAVSD